MCFLLGAGITVAFHPAVHSFMDPEALFLGTLSTATSIGITARILSEIKKISTPEGVTILLRLFWTMSSVSWCFLWWLDLVGISQWRYDRLERYSVLQRLRQWVFGLSAW